MRVAKKPTVRVKAGTSKASAAATRKAFVEAFLTNGENITKSAIEAGFSAKTAYQAGSRLLKDVRVSSEINRRRTEVIAAAELNTEQTIREVARLAFSDPRNIVNEDGSIKKLHELDADTAAAVASYEVDKDGVIKYKFWDKNSAIEKAAKIQGLYEKDNDQHAAPVVNVTTIKVSGLSEAIDAVRAKARK